MVAWHPTAMDKTAHALGQSNVKATREDCLRLALETLIADGVDTWKKL